MTVRQNFWSVGGIALVVLGIVRPVEAKPVYTILPAGLYVYAINDSGTVAGVEDSGVAFLRTPDGTITTFSPAADATGTTVYGINSSGAITGYYRDKQNKLQSFVRDADGVVTNFQGSRSRGGRGTVALGINAQGTVTGYYFDKLGRGRGFVRAADGTTAQFNVHHGEATTGWSVNDSGEVAGAWVFNSLANGFVRSADGEITSFDVPGNNLTTAATAINNEGTVAGIYVDQMYVNHGYIRAADGTFTTFDLSNGQVFSVKAINDNGDTAGVNKIDETGKPQGFVRYQNGSVKAIKPPGANDGTVALGINNDGVVAGYFLSRPSAQSQDIGYGFIWTP
jgi:hypothetical protein